MKRKVLIASLIVLIAALVTPLFECQAQGDLTHEGYGFVALSYGKQQGKTLEAGVASSLGKGFHLLHKARIGDSLMAGTEQGAYFIPLWGPVSGMIGAGAGVGWTGQESLITRLLGTGTIGLSGQWSVRGHPVFDQIGVTVYATFDSNFREDDGFRDGTIFGVAVDVGVK